MKSLTLGIAAFWALMLLSSFTAIRNIEEEPAYYISIAWEYDATGMTQPIISNVVYAACKYHSASMVSNQLNTFYNAYYRSSRHTSGINRIVSWRYDTKDKAEKKRRELIAGYNNQNQEPLLIYKFSVLCDN